MTHDTQPPIFHTPDLLAAEPARQRVHARRRGPIGRLAAALLSLALVGGVALAGSAATGSRNPSLSTPALSEVVAAPNADENSAVQQVIERANAAQVQALAGQDPTPMQATATSAYYQEMVRTNRNLLANGVTSIQLVQLEWGPIAVSDTQATATTYETWTTTFADGTSEQSRDQNDYTLVLSGGTWLVQSDDHPRTASATPASSAQGTAPSQPPVPDPSSPIDRRSTSHNWSGYAATGGSYSAVSGTWTIPQFNGSSTSGVDATWVGIGGVTSRDLIQAGTQQTVSGRGSTRYQAWVEMLPQASRPVPLTIHAGDSVTVSIAEQSTDHWLITFTNNTTGQSYQDTDEYSSSHSSAEWVEEAPSATRSGILPLDDFGTITFSAGTATKDDQTETIAQTGARAITMLGSRNQALAVPSPLGADGASFSISRTSAPSTGGVPAFPRGRRSGS